MGKSYYRVMLGEKSSWAKECFTGNFIGANYDIAQDLTGELPEEWRTFNLKFIPVFLAARPDKTRIGAGLACGCLWTICKGIKEEDIVLCPDGLGHYHVAEVIGGYTYQPGSAMLHRRPVRWLNQTIDRADMSPALRSSAGSPGGVCTINGHHDEIERLIGGLAPPTIISTDETVEDPASFVMEKHLEDFLVENWAQTDLGKEYDIYQEEGKVLGQQYMTDTGPMDILAVSKDKKSLLVVELKKGRASDAVVGQTMRYMGYVQEELAEEGQAVKGVIIALQDDQGLRRALSVIPSIQFFRYQVSFKLVKG
jgi:restriction system protein